MLVRDAGNVGVMVLPSVPPPQSYPTFAHRTPCLNAQPFRLPVPPRCVSPTSRSAVCEARGVVCKDVGFCPRQRPIIQLLSLPITQSKIPLEPMPLACWSGLCFQLIRRSRSTAWPATGCRPPTIADRVSNLKGGTSTRCRSRSPTRRCSTARGRAFTRMLPGTTIVG